jgi:hypothetical protein
MSALVSEQPIVDCSCVCQLLSALLLIARQSDLPLNSPLACAPKRVCVRLVSSVLV